MAGRRRKRHGSSPHSQKLRVLSPSAATAPDSVRGPMSLFIYTAIPILLTTLWLYTAHITRASFPQLRNKRICLLIAHPDDEAMFFAPTLLALTDEEAGNHVKILCLSNGMPKPLSCHFRPLTPPPPPPPSPPLPPPHPPPLPPNISLHTNPPPPRPRQRRKPRRDPHARTQRLRPPTGHPLRRRHPRARPARIPRQHDRDLVRQLHRLGPQFCLQPLRPLLLKQPLLCFSTTHPRRPSNRLNRHPRHIRPPRHILAPQPPLPALRREGLAKRSRAQPQRLGMSRRALHAHDHQHLPEVHWGVGRAGDDATGGVGGGGGEVRIERERRGEEGREAGSVVVCE